MIAVAVGFGRNRARRVRGAAERESPAQEWIHDDEVAVTIERDPADDLDHYWRAEAFDRIDLHGWSLSSTKTTERVLRASVLEGTADDVDPTGLRSVKFTVRPQTFTQSTILAPATPVLVDREVRLTTVGQAGYFAALERDGRDPYTVTALVSVAGDGPGMLNSSALRAAGTAYPREVVALYTTVVAGMFGPNLSALRDQIVETARSGAPIDLAERLVEVLHAPQYTYDTDLSDIDCGAMSTPECFATSKHGFCQQYAMTMAVVLRDLGVPARIVEGFLPGERSAGSALEVIRNSQALAWVEAYFPGFGWVAFDPTGGRMPWQMGAALPPGPVTPNGTPRP